MRAKFVLACLEDHISVAAVRSIVAEYAHQKFQGKLERTLFPNRSVRALCAIGNGQAAFCFHDDALEVWDVGTGVVVWAQPKTKLQISQLRRLDQSAFLSCSLNGRFLTWDVATGNHRTIVDIVRVFETFENNTKLAVVSDEQVDIIDLETCAPVCKLQGHTGWIAHLVVLSDDRTLVTAAYNTMRVWADGECLFVIKSVAKPDRCALWHAFRNGR